MKIIINEEGIVFCEGAQCHAQANGSPMCAGCILKSLFKEMYENCDPLQCRKINCAGCEIRLKAMNLLPNQDDWSI